MSGWRWLCCKCCDRIAQGDHVEHGGDIKRDRHDGPCTTCRQDSAHRIDPSRTTTPTPNLSTSEGDD